MSEHLLVLESGDRFATISENGDAVVWTINPEGMPVPDPRTVQRKSDFSYPLATGEGSKERNNHDNDQ